MYSSRFTLCSDLLNSALLLVSKLRQSLLFMCFCRSNWLQSMTPNCIGFFATVGKLINLMRMFHWTCPSVVYWSCFGSTDKTKITPQCAPATSHLEAWKHLAGAVHAKGRILLEYRSVTLARLEEPRRLYFQPNGQDPICSTDKPLTPRLRGNSFEATLAAKNAVVAGKIINIKHFTNECFSF